MLDRWSAIVLITPAHSRTPGRPQNGQWLVHQVVRPGTMGRDFRRGITWSRADAPGLHALGQRWLFSKMVPTSRDQVLIESRFWPRQKGNRQESLRPTL